MLNAKIVSGAQWPRSTRCSECKNKFNPHPRLRLRQKTCGKRECVLTHRARYRRKYRSINADSEKGYQQKVKTNRQPDFWKKYRSTHPESTKRNCLSAKLRKRLKCAGLQRQLDIVEVVDPPGFFDQFYGFAMSHRSLLENYSATHVP